MKSTFTKFTPYFMLFLPLLFFAHQFILRLWPSLMMPQIMEQYSITASEFGLFTAFYYYGYAGMQIPVAFLLDKYGSRHIISLLAILCGLAMLLFIFSTHFYVAVLSRFLIGAGSAVGVLGVSKIISEWFPSSQYAKILSLSVSFGLLGAIYGGKPINLLIEDHSARSVAFVLAFIAIILGVSAYLFLKRAPYQNTEQATEKAYSYKGLKALLSSPIIWLLAVSNLLMVGALEGFADVWGVPYLMKAFSLSKSTAAGLISFIFVGMLTGGPILTLISRKIGFYFVLFFSGIGIALLISLLFWSSFYSWYLIALVLFIIGNLCCYQVIVFALGATLVNTSQLGITIAFLNCINMLGGSFFHSVIGKLMDYSWQGNLDTSGMRSYNLLEFKQALIIVPICAVIGGVLMLLVGLKKRHSTKKEVRY